MATQFDFLSRMREIDREQNSTGNDTPKELGERRAGVARQLKGLAELVIRENRDFTPQEQVAWDALDASYDDISEQIISSNPNAFNRGMRKMHTDLIGRDNVDHRASTRDGRDGGTGTGARFVDQRGREVRMLRPNESYRAAVCPDDDDAELSIGKCIVGLATGKWQDADAERRAMLGVTDTAGGYLLPDPLSSRVIDLARAKTVVMAAGAQTVPMDSATLTLARVTQDPTAYWHGEGAQISTSDAALGAAILTARTLVAIVPISVELVEDSPNAASVVQNCLTQALALEMDRGVLRGTGSANEPLGIVNYPNITTTAIGGALSYDNMLDSLTPIEVANGSPNAWICNPATNGYLRKLKQGDGVYIVGHPALDQIQKLVSNQCLSSQLFVGDFRQVVFGLRKNITIEVFRSGTAGGQDAVDRMLVFVRAYMRADSILMQPSFFNVLTGIT